MISGYRRFFMVIACAALWASLAQADYHYASHEGSNEYPYTSWETAAHLIQDAVDAASPHDTLYIGEGDYYERIIVPESTTHLGMIGMGWENTRIWYDVQGQEMILASDSCVVENVHLNHMRGVSLSSHFYTNLLTVRNCRFTTQDFFGVGIMSSFTGNSMIIENCLFYGLGECVDAAVGRPPFIIIKNCLFDLIGYSAIYGWAAKFVIQRNICTGAGSNFYWWYGPVDTTIFTNNLSIDNDGAFGDGSIHEWDVINNNISIDDSRYIYAAFLFDPVYDLRAYNNIVIGETYGIDVYIRQPQYHADLRYNNLINGIQDIRVWYYENIDTSVIYHEFPMFVGDGNYHLQAFSPMIDAGNPEILDIDGTRSDVGAHGGPLGESYEYLDLPPLIPDSIVYTAYLDSIVFIWHINQETDFSNYLIHRDTVSGFEPSEFNLLAEPDSSYFVDEAVEFGQTYYYRFASLDNQGNLSDYSEELGVFQTGIWTGPGTELPTITSIESNYPNPFNSQTTIVYTVANLGPIPAKIGIDIYDIGGRKVRTLVDERKEVGIHKVVWDGRNDNDQDCPSGVYFARIVQWDLGFLGRSQKLVLLR